MPRTGSHRPHLTGLESFLASRTLPGPKFSFPRAGCPASPQRLLWGPSPSLTDTAESSGPRPKHSGAALVHPCGLRSGHSELALSGHLSFFPRPPSQPCAAWKQSPELPKPAAAQLRALLLPPSVCHPRCRCCWPSLPGLGDVGAQKQQGPNIPHGPQREIHKSKGPERTKLSHQPITEPDLKITPGQRPASCESPPGQSSHSGPRSAGEKHLRGQLAVAGPTWEVWVSAGWLQGRCATTTWGGLSHGGIT